MKQHEHLSGIMSSILHSRWSKRISVSMLLAFTLTFCGCLSRPPLNKQTFAFSTPLVNATNGAAIRRLLRIQSLQISPPFDGRSFIYRTGEFLYERDPYAGFLGQPAEQLAGPVSEILRRSGCFSDVVEPGSPVRPDDLVDITITQLYGDIRKPKAPFAVLAMRVTFLKVTNDLSGRVMLEQSYSRRISIASTTPAALMAGWNRALVEILAEVAADFRTQEINEQLRDNSGDNLSQK
jgi:cholesterol transport system auxiliary component